MFQPLIPGMAVPPIENRGVAPNDPSQPPAPPAGMARPNQGLPIPDRPPAANDRGRGTAGATAKAAVPPPPGPGAGAVRLDDAFPPMMDQNRAENWHADQPSQASDPWAGIMSTDPNAMRIDQAF